MRLKHIKGSEQIILKASSVIHNPKEYKGNYNKIFNNDNPIYLEVGVGKGNFIIAMAKENPNINFIGIEKYDSVLIKAIRKIENDELPNLRFIKFDATYIEDIFDKDIEKIYLNFSDPWPKNRHADRRLSSERFLKRYDKVFKNKKEIIMKTDNQGLFEYSLINFTNHHYKIQEISLDISKTEIPNVLTEYEEKFRSVGKPIYYVKVTN